MDDTVADTSYPHVANQFGCSSEDFERRHPVVQLFFAPVPVNNGLLARVYDVEVGRQTDLFYLAAKHLGPIVLAAIYREFDAGRTSVYDCHTPMHQSHAFARNFISILVSSPKARGGQ
jgi:hypothetical protein